MNYNGITGVQELPPPIIASYEDKMLAVKTPNLIYGLPATHRALPARGGRILRVSRYHKLPTFEVPLSGQGDPVAPTQLKRLDIDARISYFGQFVATVDQVIVSNQDPALNQAAELLGLSMRETEDNLIKNMILSGASSLSAEGGNNGDNPTNLSPFDIDNATTVLLSEDAWQITNSQIGEDRFGTSPIRAAYVALCNVKLVPDLNTLPGFVSKWNYANAQDTVSSEWGSFNNARFFVSSQGAVKRNASMLDADIYPITFQGMEATSIVHQDNYSMRFIYKPPFFSDALNQIATMGVTFATVPFITNDSWLVNLNVTLSA